ncbi:hypothetical protein GCM10011362_08330 [Marinobacter halophilus]|nr:hypothetical protein GCM10011362_08330 [Marinobacter halophilus]
MAELFGKGVRNIYEHIGRISHLVPTRLSIPPMGHPGSERSPGKRLRRATVGPGFAPAPIVIEALVVQLYDDFSDMADDQALNYEPTR